MRAEAEAKRHEEYEARAAAEASASEALAFGRQAMETRATRAEAEVEGLRERLSAAEAARDAAIERAKKEAEGREMIRMMKALGSVETDDNEEEEAGGAPPPPPPAPPAATAAPSAASAPPESGETAEGAASPATGAAKLRKKGGGGMGALWRKVLPEVSGGSREDLLNRIGVLTAQVCVNVRHVHVHGHGAWNADEQVARVHMCILSCSHGMRVRGMAIGAHSWGRRPRSSSRR